MNSAAVVSTATSLFDLLIASICGLAPFSYVHRPEKRGDPEVQAEVQRRLGERKKRVEPRLHILRECSVATHFKSTDPSIYF